MTDLSKLAESLKDHNDQYRADSAKLINKNLQTDPNSFVDSVDSVIKELKAFKKSDPSLTEYQWKTINNALMAIENLRK